jgi:hypothetical protein
MLVENLIACNNLKQAQDYLDAASEAVAGQIDPLRKRLSDIVKAHSKDKDSIPEPDEYPEWGRVRREVYPWNSHEPDRSTQESLASLNELLATAAPKLEARITELPDLTKPERTGTVKQIGLFAKEDIAPAEQILSEKSILTATARMNDSFCDACAAKLPGLNAGDGGEYDGSAPVSCPQCDETVFCSTDCLDLAQESYHPALCGKDTSSLAKDASAKEAADSLYALLLLRAFALAAHGDIHPLDLIQIRYLWGDFVAREPALPFNIHYNIILPLTMLEKMEINTFTSSHHFSPWVFNTLYAKFRGTADARQGPDGRPEIGAVHPLWCLANHSCAPNLRWEWEGRMGFWVRTNAQRVDWRPSIGREDGVKDCAGAGLKKDDEVLGHYCDVELPVKERREWARGALGGDCMCERCVWEAAHPEKVKKCTIAR